MIGHDLNGFSGAYLISSKELNGSWQFLYIKHAKDFTVFLTEDVR